LSTNPNIQAQLELLREKSLYRHLRGIDSPQGSHVFIQGTRYVNFSSNDYLGLADDEALKSAAQAAIQKWGTGSGASRLVTGSLKIHHDLEERIAAFKQEERGVIFSSGFQANLGTIQALAGSEDTVFVDRYCHASLIDGARLSGARLRVYPHCDMDRLGELLGKCDKGQKLILTDTYFSMDGDVAPLPELLEMARRHEAILLVDDAHAVGVMGPEGRGLTEAFGLQGQIDVVVGTFSKALGSQGGFVVGQKSLIEFLINKARTLIYTTGSSPANSAAALRAIELIQADGSRRQRLWENVRYLREGIAQLGFDLLNSEGPIIPLILGETSQALHFSKTLEGEGILAPAIRPPTVPRGTDRVRLSVTAKHSKDDLDHLINTLRKI